MVALKDMVSKAFEKSAKTPIKAVVVECLYGKQRYDREEDGRGLHNSSFE